MRYVPANVPSSSQGLLRWLADELRRVANAINEPDVIQLSVRGTAPVKPREGMIAFADGTVWDPGSGAGAYEYRGGAWQKL